MNAELKAKWVAALRSGDYKQAHGALRKLYAGELGYCCLGVLCEVAEVPQEETGYRFTPTVWHDEITPRDWQITPNHRETLMTLNDELEESFSQIADYIETNL